MTKPAMPRYQSRKRALALPSQGAEAPSPERRRRDPIELVEGRDPEGWLVAHYQVPDTVARLIRIGLVEPPCAAAADRFRRDFAMARVDPLATPDWSRPLGARRHEVIADRIEDARYRLWRAVQHLGGMASPAGSAIWHIVGGELSLNEWTLRQVWGGGKTLRHEVATGVLVAALSALSAHYDGPSRASKAR